MTTTTTTIPSQTAHAVTTATAAQQRRRPQPVAPLFSYADDGDSASGPHADEGDNRWSRAGYGAGGGRGEHQQQINLSARAALYESRASEMKRVEKTIAELGGIFMKVAGLVAEQQELVDDIEANVDDTATNTAEAQSELFKLLQFVSADRALIIRLLIAVTLLGMVVIWFWT